MNMKKMFASLIISLIAVIGLVACSGDNERTSSNGERKLADTLNVALSGQPESIDPLSNSSEATTAVSRNIFETLVTLNGDFEPELLLAESIDENEDGTVHTVKLREGVKFHNGEEMKAEDVVASMYYWYEKSSSIPSELVMEFEVVNDYELEIILEEKTPDLLTLLAGQRGYAAVMPKDVIENAGASGVTEYIGTGPFEFVEHKRDEYTHFKKYEDYQPVEGEAIGLAGKREVHFENLYIYYATDGTTRESGLKTGQYDIVTEMPTQSYEQLIQEENINLIPQLNGKLLLYYNEHEPIFKDQKMRLAANTALNATEIMQAIYSHEDLYELTHNLMRTDNKQWTTDVGSEGFNVADPEKAKKILSETSYSGEPIRLIAPNTAPHASDAAVVIQKQLEEIGMNVEINLYDGPTIQQMIREPGSYDLYIGSDRFVELPDQLGELRTNEPGHMADETKDNMLEAIRTEEDKDKARELFEELQVYVREEHIPVTMFGYRNTIVGTSLNVEDLIVFDYPVYWNVKKYEK